jgi:hypothetical protein
MRVVAIGLALALASCSTLNFAGRISTGEIHNISPAAVYKMEASYTAAMVGLAAYRQLPFCPENAPLCQKKSVARTLSAADAHALKALRDLEAFAREHPKLDATALIVGAQLAISNAEGLAEQYGVKK